MRRTKSAMLSGNVLEKNCGDMQMISVGLRPGISPQAERIPLTGGRGASTLRG
ncbi:hypothetical protein ACH4TX_06340 [Streptomyces sp. NPDC021098]|uniref:hypothetical protein n=1 Tax=unclassified Streptomyces TaxID=2593676 RepID=UPI0037917D63